MLKILLNLQCTKFYLVFLVIFLVLLSGCAEDSVMSNTIEEGIHKADLTIEMDPIFRAFYEHHGGEDVLGRAISSVQKKGSSEYQCTEAVCIIFNPNQPENVRFRLAPIGEEMGVSEPPVPIPNDDALFIDGHVIYHEFEIFYREIGGMNFVGSPLTEARLNTNAKRIEQYFENLGLYRSLSDPTGAVRLLAYGAWSCGSLCRDHIVLEGAVEIYPNISLPFIEFVQQIGTDLTGFPLTRAYLAPDGKIEQIFERVVLAVDSGDAEKVILRQLPIKLGLPINEADESNELQAFQQHKVINGHEVPSVIWELIEDHGGESISGDPISGIVSQYDKTFQQCFENFCLLYNEEFFNLVYLQPEMLGYAYRDIYYQDLPSVSQITPQGDEITLQAWTKYTSIGSNMEQEFWVRVMKNDVPIQSASLYLIKFLPYGDTVRMDFPLTLVDGYTSILDLSTQAPNGTLIPYQVCMVTGDGQETCITDDYLIWNSP